MDGVGKLARRVLRAASVGDLGHRPSRLSNLLEQNDDWAVQRARNTTLETIAL
jgi:hypothetical protein